MKEGYILEIVDFIKPELLILVPVLYIVGVGLKKSALPDRFIPIFLGLGGIILSAIWTFTTCEFSDYHCILTGIFASFTQGILCSGASVYANQIYKQIINKKGEK